MRNSVMPLLAVIVVVGIALVSLRGQSQPGMYGPDIFPGIFRLPQKDKFPVVSATLTIDNMVEVEGEAPAQHPETWRVVQISARDRGPMTRAVVLSLAETLTKHGSIAIVDPAESEPFPMGCDRVIAVQTTTGNFPEQLGGDGSATVVVSSQLARFPNEHPAARLQRDAAGQQRRLLTISHRSRANGTVDGWPQWWAGCGRKIAADVLSHLAPGGLPPVSDPETHAWLPQVLPPSDWGTAMMPPLSTEHLRWEFAFQEELIRGWLGHIAGATVTTRKGDSEPALEQIQKRLQSGNWEQAGAAGVSLYTRDGKNGTEWFSYRELSEDAGIQVSWWQEQTGIPERFAEWDKAAQAGDVLAARRLTLYQANPMMPPEIKQRLETKPTTP